MLSFLGRLHGEGMPYEVGFLREKCLDSRFQPRLDWHSGRVTCDNRQQPNVRPGSSNCRAFLRVYYSTYICSVSSSPISNI